VELTVQCSLRSLAELGGEGRRERGKLNERRMERKGKDGLEKKKKEKHVESPDELYRNH